MIKYTILAALATATASHGATIAWGSAYNFNHTDETLFLNSVDSSRNGGVTAVGGSTSLFSAIDYRAAGAAPTVNGIVFTSSGGASDFWGNTGINPNIDSLLSGHTSAAGTFTLNLTGLTVGKTYQIQLIGIHDSRGGINNRQQEVSFGGSDFTSGGTPVILTRNGYGNTNPANPGSFDGFDSFGTVVGTFTADATSQEIQLRSNQQDGNNGDDVDPGLGGYILHEFDATPEPSSTALLGLGGLALILRRRK